MAAKKATGVGFPSDGERVARFLETYVTHTKGRFAGLPFKPEAWQRDFLNELYRLNPETGARVYSEALLLIPRKNGKSTLAAALGLFHLVGDDEASPEVYVAAGSRDQASAVFRQARSMVETSDGLSDFVTPMRWHLESPDNMGVYRVLSSDANLQHGTNPSASIIDEYWTAKNGDILTALTSGTGAREQPMSLIISTAGHDKNGPLGLLHKRAYELPDELRESRPDESLTIVRDTENGFLYWLFAPAWDSEYRYSNVDLDDPATWAKANPASWITQEYLTRQFNKPSVRVSEFQRFHLNVYAEAEEYVFPAGAWESGRADFEPIEDGASVVLGVDLGQRRDRSAVTIVRSRLIGDSKKLHFDVVAKVWDPPAEGNFDINTIRSFIDECCTRYDVKRIAYDPWRLEATAQAGQDTGQPWLAFSMGWARSAPASAALYDAVVEGRVHHDGDPVLAAHVAASAVTESEAGGFRFTKRKSGSNPVDALIALMMALAESINESGHASGSVYESQELIVL